jgi:hypothetical protein
MKTSFKLIAYCLFSLFVLLMSTSGGAAIMRFSPVEPEAGERITVRVITTDLGPCDRPSGPPRAGEDFATASLENGEIIVRLVGYCSLGLLEKSIVLYFPLSPLPVGTYPVRYIRTSNGGVSVPETFGPVYFLTVKAASGTPPEPVPLSDGALVILMLAMGIVAKRRLLTAPKFDTGARCKYLRRKS